MKGWHRKRFVNKDHNLHATITKGQPHVIRIVFTWAKILQQQHLNKQLQRWTFKLQNLQEMQVLKDLIWCWQKVWRTQSVLSMNMHKVCRSKVKYNLLSRIKNQFRELKLFNPCKSNKKMQTLCKAFLVMPTIKPRSIGIKKVGTS